MITFNFTHRSDDGSEASFTNDTRDLYRWEVTDKGKRSFLATVNESGGALAMTDLYRLAWIAAHRLGLVTCDLDAYTKDYALDVDMEEVTEDSPSHAAASAGE